MNAAASPPTLDQAGCPLPEARNVVGLAVQRTARLVER
jgi:hypothetical protein